MLKRLALLAVLPLVLVAVAACGDDDSASSTPTATSNASPGGSSLPSFVFSVTPSAPPGTPTPVASTTVWQIGGQYTGTPDMGVFSCTPTVGYYQVLLRGQLDGQAFNILVYTPKSGTLDYADPASELTINAQLGTGGDTPASSWYETAGNRGVTGTVVINNDGTGSVSGVSVPPAASVPGGANAPLTISGSWKCLPVSIS